MRSVRLGSGSAYWGDVLEPAVELAERGGCDYIGFDHLAELTLAIFQRIKAKDPQKGYIEDIGPWMDAILPIARDRGSRLLTNAGAANPLAGAKVVARVAAKHGLTDTRIGVVTGDDVLEMIPELRAQGVQFPNLDTGEEDITRIEDQIIAANAYIGAEGMVEALADGAHVVVAGRVSDNALFVAPMMHELGWNYDDPERMGAAVTIGHLLECSALATGAVSNFWRDAVEAWRIGFPIADVDEAGTAIFTKTPDSGGLINEWTVKEQLVYEIHDPQRYLMPDGVADFTRPRIEDAGAGEVRVSGCGGSTRPETLKVCIGYEDGWIQEGIALFSWPDARDKAERAAQIVRERLKLSDVHPRDIQFDYIGDNTLHGPVAPPPRCEPNEVGLRVAAHTDSREEADAVRRAVTHLWTLGGIGSAIQVPSRARPVIALWPTLIPRDAVDEQVEVIGVDV